MSGVLSIIRCLVSFFLFNSSYGNIFNKNMRQMSSRYSMLIYTYVLDLVGTKYKNGPKAKQNLLKTFLKKILGSCSALGGPSPFKFCKGCLPQILLGPFLNILSQMSLSTLLND